MKANQEARDLLLIPQRLAAVAGLKEKEVRVVSEARAAAKAHPADLLLAAGAHRFVVEYKGRANAADVLNAIRQVREFVAGAKGKAIPLVAVPYMGAVGQQLCAEAGVSWLDLSGNAHVEAPGLRVHVEGKPNRFIRPGRPATVFAPKSSRIARWLLMHPQECFSQQQLAVATGLDKGLTSRLVRELETQRLVVREANGAVRVTEFNTLLDAWREVYDFSRHSILRGHMATRSSDESLRRISKAMEQNKVDHAATGLAGAWLLNHFAGFRIVTCYVAWLPPADILHKMGFHEESRGENVWLVVPNDDGVFQGAEERDGVRCAHPVQVYLDLKGHPERSAEAADRLRRSVLIKDRHA
ncbi:MAG: type IV toxin-antitoxin system AbiEi family antitoxin [Magnetococcus sp. WYHC-3]